MGYPNKTGTGSDPPIEERGEQTLLTWQMVSESAEVFNEPVKTFKAIRG